MVTGSPSACDTETVSAWVRPQWWPSSVIFLQRAEKPDESGGGGIRTLDGRKPPITVFETNLS